MVKLWPYHCKAVDLAEWSSIYTGEFNGTKEEEEEEGKSASNKNTATVVTINDFVDNFIFLFYGA